MYFYNTYLYMLKYQKEAECVKKSELTHSAFLVYCAKNDRFVVNNRESVELCYFMTYNAMFFAFYTLYIFYSQIFFEHFCKKYGIALNKHYRCIFIKSFWVILPISYQ